MNYYSTNGLPAGTTLREAVIRGLAPDRGLYMPEKIKRLPDEFFENIVSMTDHEIAAEVASAFFGDDIPEADLRRIVEETLSFDLPVVKVSDGIYSLELFHGPTLAFKDVGARFMARLLRYFVQSETKGGDIHVLVATSGDTGSAVANGFLGVEGIKVHVLYPKGKVSPIQECQFTTLGQNIEALEIDGTFDDCQRLVKTAFMDDELNAAMRLTSANSINVARFLPQSFYYFIAYAALRRAGVGGDIVVCVPSGNFGNLTAGLFAKRMGLPVKRFVAANNANDVVYEYLQTGQYNTRPSVQTVANAMDVGDPSNFARILDLYSDSHTLDARGTLEAIRSDIEGATYSDGQIMETIHDCNAATGYVLDPHGATAYRALTENLRPGETGVFLETAHPAKFKETVERALGSSISIPAPLLAFMQGHKQCIPLSPDFTTLKKHLLTEKV